MGFFNYNNPVIQFMVKVANMMIVSFYWVLCCLPVVTILPSCAGLYYTVTRAVFQGNGSGITRTFFTAFKSALKPGVALSAIVDVLTALVYLGVITGLQIWRENSFGAFYLAAGLVIALLLVQAVIFAGPTLSRFEGSLTVVIRLSLYFAGRHIVRSTGYALLLAVMVYLMGFFPLLLLIVPALYTDLIHGGVEKTMNEYIEMAGLKQTDDGGEAPPQDQA